MHSTENLFIIFRKLYLLNINTKVNYYVQNTIYKYKMFVFINHNKIFFNMVNHPSTYFPICVLKWLRNQYMDTIINIIEYLVEWKRKSF